MRLGRTIGNVASQEKKSEEVRFRETTKYLLGIFLLNIRDLKLQINQIGI